MSTLTNYGSGSNLVPLAANSGNNPPEQPMQFQSGTGKMLVINDTNYAAQIAWDLAATDQQYYVAADSWRIITIDDLHSFFYLFTHAAETGLSSSTGGNLIIEWYDSEDPAYARLPAFGMGSL